MTSSEQDYNQFMLRKDVFLFLLLGVVFIMLISVPYVWAFNNAGSDHDFGGFLLNPIDGNSYLAKMYQGWLGWWKFSLPYTHQPGSGGYLFLFYLALGQITRLVNGSLLGVFHISRIIGSIILVLSIWNFFHQTMTSRRSLWLAFSLALLGSGLGWVAATYGLFTADFWVAEGYPFLSAYANPHFPLGTAILIWVLSPNREFDQKARKIFRFLPDMLLVFLGLLLALILPFGVVIAGVVLGGLGLWEFVTGYPSKIREHRTKPGIADVLRDISSWKRLIFVLLGGLPMMIYQIWITQSNPELAAWNAQNFTASPAIWDLILSYSPIILLAIPGGYLVWKSKESKAMLLLIWAVLGLLMLYIPWSLQRRFLLGYMIPLAGLAAVGLDHLFMQHRKSALVLLILVVLLIVPTNLMILVGGIQAVNVNEPKILLSHEEIAALNWIALNADQEAIVLASPEMGLFVPAYTGRRVVYGHPFETISAAEMQEAVEDFFSGQIDIEELPVSKEVDFILYGPREKEFGTITLAGEFKLVHHSGDVRIFEITSQN